MEDTKKSVAWGKQYVRVFVHAVWACTGFLYRWSIRPNSQRCVLVVTKMPNKAGFCFIDSGNRSAVFYLDQTDKYDSLS